ncbi:MAG: cytochrome C biogenesis protein [candidate division Zixibacteria bacterium HGW-Zixibacteria-1]|nr:MAG: cytochrome C biogenesis protein [candidate division Zixibacteria bacterium HGW-Zixibacteria-1]
MDTFFVGAASAVWLGILTSISPCPLATNIAAISFIGRKVGDPRAVIFSGLMYMLGRMLVYIILGMIIVASLLSMSELSFFLQDYINKFIGPILIVVGIILLGLIPINLPSFGISTRLQDKAARYGVWGAGLLGLIFALSFCPVSAALFFGSLIPLAVRHQSSLIMPSLYGIGTALPVMLFAFVLGLGTGAVSKIFNSLTQFELWARRVTAIIFIIVGIYYTLIYIFGIQI